MNPAMNPGLRMGSRTSDRNNEVISCKRKIESLFKNTLLPKSDKYINMYNEYKSQSDKLHLHIRISQDTVMTIIKNIKEFGKSHEKMRCASDNKSSDLAYSLLMNTSLYIRIVEDMIDELIAECEILLIPMTTIGNNNKDKKLKY